MTAELMTNHLWQSSCFALFAGLLALVLRNSPAKVRYWIWLGASLKFLAPLALLLSLGSMVPRPAQRVPWATDPVPFIPDVIVQIAEPFTPPSYSAVPAHDPTRWLPAAIGIVWAFGFLTIASARCRSWSRIRAALRVGTPIDLPIPVPALVAPSVTEPGIVGFLRPVLLLPPRLLEHLNSRQLDAVLAHEMCHVRRHDNFFAAIHMAVEAIFWFHPLVWWIGSRMVEERERACDEEVLRLGCEPADYVEGILKVCRFYKESPLPCVSGVTGADIKKRLRAILAGSIAREWNVGKKAALAAIGLATLTAPVVMGVLNAPAIRAQNAPEATFTAVSIKPSTDPPKYSMTHQVTAGRVHFVNVALQTLILDAYGIKDYQLFSGANLLAGSWNVEATMPSDSSPEQVASMFRTLLNERFGLQEHSEKRVISVYALISLAGNKLQPTTDPSGRLFWTSGTASTFRIGGRGPMSELANLLGRQVGRPVFDRTGLEGRYQIDIEYSRDVTGENAAGQDDLSAPSLYTVLKERLGLKLELRKEEIDCVVVDKVSLTPTPN
jgi:uncharacterized protein (TIGR03435 family)